MGVIDGSYRSASVYAVDDTICLVTDISYVEQLAGGDRIALGYVLYAVFAEILAARLRRTTEELARAMEEIAVLESRIG
jgi:CRP-like cAMP-binding protein